MRTQGSGIKGVRRSHQAVCQVHVCTRQHKPRLCEYPRPRGTPQGRDPTDPTAKGRSSPEITPNPNGAAEPNTVFRKYRAHTRSRRMGKLLRIRARLLQIRRPTRLILTYRPRARRDKCNRPQLVVQRSFRRSLHVPLSAHTARLPQPISSMRGQPDR